MLGMLGNQLARRFTSSSRTRVSAQIKFCCIEEGRGGTLRFRNPLMRPVQYDGEAQERIRYVGTLGVKTCRADPWYNTAGDRTVRNDAEADFFRTTTREKLKEHTAAHDWDPKTSESRILHPLLLVCPEPTGKPQDSPIPQKHLRAEQSGFYVAEGVREFLGLPSSPSNSGRLQAASGFVVWHPRGEPVLAPHEQRGTAWRVVGEQGNLEAAVPELKGYQKSPEYRVDDWTIVRQAWECR
ncbi:hypothetical protein B0A55_07391 [Friedmanniomyces simplex]|uniref:Uncharacterized protein n=1 Tax=Friedmanniomyces simplex TaxID=329884 RepID=A0A4V6WL31_9PEZI|nr:hypothetical protein B0A55_07391 [Friedmanniomyces simplex]